MMFVGLRAIIFDLDGVLLDSEPLHFAAFKKTLGSLGNELTQELYTERYLAMDDRGAFTRFYQDHKRPLSKDDLHELMEQKSKAFDELAHTEGILPYPAVPEFVMAAAQRYPLAVATGARRHEAEFLLETAGIRPHFEAIISADDVERGKPDPESFIKALAALNTGKRPTPIKAEECVVIEDSKYGIVSAHSAGMKCVAVATSHPSFELSGADLVVTTIASLKMTQIEDLFATPLPQPVPSPHPQN
jgi:HAD superfamily hydrolase (TIGR01509 family)